MGGVHPTMTTTATTDLSNGPLARFRKKLGWGGSISRKLAGCASLGGRGGRPVLREGWRGGKEKKRRIKAAFLGGKGAARTREEATRLVGLPRPTEGEKAVLGQRDQN